MTTLTEFTIAWVQTPSDYDFLIARTVRDDWAAMNLPVISRRGVHHLYTGYHVTEPNGAVLICPYDCGIENRNWDSTKKKQIIVKCRRCKGSCSFRRVELDSKALLGSRRIIKVDFPPPQITIIWTYPPDAPTVVKPVRKLPPRPPRPTPQDGHLHLPGSASFMPGVTTPSIVVTPPQSHAPTVTNVTPGWRA
jgi:hypothetical protein